MSTKKVNKRKKTVVFVGAFRESAQDGTIGGQIFACRSLLESPISLYAHWYLIDSTMVSQPPPGLLTRVCHAVYRLTKLIKYLTFKEVDSVFIFTSYELSSFLEKGVMVLISRIYRKRVIFSPRTEIKEFKHDRWLKWFKVLVFSKTNIIISQSEKASNYLVCMFGINAKNILFVPNWIDGSKYRRIEDINIKDKTEKITFLFVGWLEKFKGVQDLLSASHILMEKGVRHRLIICGGGSQKDILEERSRELGLEGFVEFRGWVTGSQKIKAYHEADVFILPSYSEGLPNAVLEAMASSLAIIATSVGGVSTLIESGNNGILVDPGDPLGLADSMQNLVQDPILIRKFGQLNRKKIEDIHDVSRVWQQVARALSLEF